MEIALFIIGILVGIIATMMYYEQKREKEVFRPLPHYVPRRPYHSWSVDIADINNSDGIGAYVTIDNQWREARLVEEPCNNNIRIEDKLTGHMLGHVPTDAIFAVRKWTLSNKYIHLHLRHTRRKRSGREKILCGEYSPDCHRWAREVIEPPRRTSESGT